ncbi:MAG: histidine--tRNA ligase [Candidatus Omnitrophica bacterium]|nr:histidine--tRNA ligase [Candidatus Omnitrophota bacterium]
MYQALRGTYDLLPDEAERLRSFLNRAISILERAGFREIETPIIEEARLFDRSVGEGSDIVSKEMYTFPDRKNRLLALRPEGTAPIVRACIEHNIYYANPSVRLYYFGPMFRYNRPQKGRYRQFLQLGVEIFGSEAAYTDAECLYLLSEILKEAGTGSFCVELNSLGCRTCQDNYGKTLAEFLEKRKEELCEDCRNRLQKNPLRTLDCKTLICKEILQDSPAIKNSICIPCEEKFKEVLRYCDMLGVKYRINDKLVRGLDYYTQTVFEVIAEDGGNAIAAGGRYDKLVEDMGGRPTPAIGFAFGLERCLFNSVRAVEPKKKGIRLVYLDKPGETRALEKAFKLMVALRRQIETPVTLSSKEGKKIGNQLAMADKDNCRFALIFGPEEIEKGEVILRDLDSGTQESLKETDLTERVKKC